jgi:hypothetical protein
VVVRDARELGSDNSRLTRACGLWRVRRAEPFGFLAAAATNDLSDSISGLAAEMLAAAGSVHSMRVELTCDARSAVLGNAEGPTRQSVHDIILEILAATRAVRPDFGIDGTYLL